MVSTCQLCGETDEKNSHLMLHCTFTAQLWNFTLTDTNGPCLSTLQICLSCWIRRGGSKSLEEMVEIADVLKMGPIPFVELIGIVLVSFFCLV